MIKLIKKIKTIRFRWSDLFLLIGVLSFGIFLLFGKDFMFHLNPDEVPLKIWMAIPIFVLGLASYIVYIILEGRSGNLPNKYLNAFFAFVVFVGIVSILYQPSTLETISTYRHGGWGHKPGDVVNVVINITNTHRAIFIFEMTLMFFLMYTGFFIFPKRVKSYACIIGLAYMIFIALLVVAVYSYIVEHDKYVNYVKVLFGLVENENLSTYSIISIVTNPNAVAMVFLVGICMAFIANSIKRHWWYYPIAIYFYLHILFTYCRGSIILSTVIIIAYFYFRIISNIRRKKALYITLLSLYSSLLVGIVVITVLVITKKGDFFPHLYHAYELLTKTNSVVSRVDIWKDSLFLLKDGYWRMGRGFGVFNEYLLVVNPANDVNVMPSHQGSIGVLAEGGITFALAYILLLVYTMIIFIKTVKMNYNVATATFMSIFIWFAYTFVETIQYLMYPFIMVLMVSYHVSKYQKQLIKE